MTPKPHRSLMPLLALACLAACATPAPTPTPTLSAALPAPQASLPAPTATAQALDAAGKAVDDLSLRLAVPPAAIQVVAIKPMTWPDTSLGLPKPGESYAQVVTSGYVVTLGYARQSYVYHVSDGIVRLDEAQSAPVPTAPPF